MYRLGIDWILCTLFLISSVASTNAIEKTCSPISQLPVVTATRLHGAVIEKFTTSGVVSCAKECLSRRVCLSCNFNLDDGTCELNSEGGTVINGTVSLKTEPSYVYSMSLNWTQNILGVCQHHNCAINSRCVETADGGWACVITYCTDPPTVEHANDIDSSINHVTVVNWSLTLECIVGYVPCGTLTCNPDGTWTRVTCMPVSTCTEVQQLGPSYTDGEYWLYPRQLNSARVKVYCHGMNSTASEYISLSTPYFMDGPMVANPGCRGEIPILNPNPSLGYHVYTKFGLNIETLSITITDRRFYNRTGGMDANVGVVKDCYVLRDSACGPRGRAVMDLRGTGFALDGLVTWAVVDVGWTPIVTRSSKDQVIEIRCGGRCGKCSPQDPLRLVLVESDVPPDKSALTPQCDPSHTRQP
ncbi:A disintegrin and metalloproteinase with thrombospondin motifs 9-like [Haliotis cracherodii]|uniref:A disintegrin and metalloproteinase with thrombospondin motifs 9-like n=1 Tax=Haliotis cracherodii TaxID=6455 RepID=UPI0039EC45E7